MLSGLKSGVADAIVVGGYPEDVTVIEDASEKDLTGAKGAIVATVDSKLAQKCYDAGWGGIGTVDGDVVHSDGSKGLSVTKAPSTKVPSKKKAKK